MDGESRELVRAEDASPRPFARDIGLEELARDLPVAKRAEVAEVAAFRRVDLADDVAQRAVRLQAADADMERVLRQAGELSRMKADFVVRSRHETASGTAEITVRSHSVWIYAALAAVALVLVLKLL